jgi:hypothetical protein
VEVETKLLAALQNPSLCFSTLQIPIQALI